MKKNRPKVDLGLVYTMYGGVGYPGYYYDPEVSYLVFRYMRYYVRKFWRSFKRSYKVYIATMEKNPMAFANLF